MTIDYTSKSTHSVVKMMENYKAIAHHYAITKPPDELYRELQLHVTAALIQQKTLVERYKDQFDIFLDADKSRDKDVNERTKVSPIQNI